MSRMIRLLSLLIVGAIAASACQPITAQPTQPQTADQSAVIDAVGPSTASDPAQAQAEDEFRAVALAKEQAFYARDVDRVLSFYADLERSTLKKVKDSAAKKLTTRTMTLTGRHLGAVTRGKEKLSW